ncbi:hypothetical protein L1987_38395 [Smallanthus sonchifolius]|uniref:Uncharacterized protein n=1 Tax=Smallanthus sonchifolius TaxID=185202 RepID=A0ACB9HK88_9ASTR|nr:hypothetical protein L1987_38395 [Smallanthus sonchifolius]
MWVDDGDVWWFSSGVVVANNRSPPPKVVTISDHSSFSWKNISLRVILQQHESITPFRLVCISISSLNKITEF